jgi:long-chain acyl-CoA synthetase
MDAFATSYDPQPVRDWVLDQPIKTIPQLFDCSVENYPTTRFLGRKLDGQYTYQTYEKVAGEVLKFASALLQQGIEAHDRVAQISNNRPEWVITDLGTMAVGAVHAPLYATVSHDAFTYILNDSAARILVAENEGHLDMIKACQKNLKSLEGVVALCPFDAANYKKLKVWSWEDFLKLGEEALDSQRETIQARKNAIEATDVCSLIYTSGTTGEPKGAMLMHGNFLSNSICVRPNIPMSPGEIELSFLPLSHVFERTLYYLVVTIGGTIAYAESFETVRDNIVEIRPHLVASVPRLYEKIHAAVVSKATNATTMPRMRKRLFTWAFDIGKQYCEAKWKGSIPPVLAAKNKLAHKLVFSKIHAATGGRIKIFASGGAPLRADVCEFFLSAGLDLIEGYGLTETSPVITMNPPERPKVGTVGTTIQHVEVKIADDNEILTRGPHVMLGYFNKLEATKQAINDEGWFHTGDIGEFDSDGYLKITDRKKEIIVLSNGKNVAPSPIEQAIKESRYIEQCVLLGDARNFISALVVPAYEAMSSWCKENGVKDDPIEMADNTKVVEFLTDVVKKACEPFSPYEQVKKIAVLPRELSQDDGELTPTLKIKRRVVNDNFADRIEAIYTKQA